MTEEPQAMWQPIETAPKGADYDRILLKFKGPFTDTTEIGVAVGCWSGDGWWLTCIWASSGAHRSPTHWMPLPGQAPTDEANLGDDQHG